MNLKTMVIVIVLAVIFGAVYVSLHDNGEAPPPPGLADGWGDPPSIEMPEVGGSGFPFASEEGAAAASPGGLAPPFNPDRAFDGELDAPTVAGAPPDQTAPTESFSAGPDGMPRPDEPRSRDRQSNEVRKAFFDFLQAAHEELAKGNFREVLEKLSVWYDKPQLTAEEQRQLTELLDQVAGTVIYSREHRLERPYVVASGDTLPRIARAYGVPWQLLAKINGIADPEHLEPGRELKVVRGPFDAVIRLDRCEMTLMLQDLYAGRFRIGIGRVGDIERLEGTYQVEDKIVNDHATSPTGRYVIRLSDDVALHGTDDPRDVGTRDAPGSICLGDRDIEDVHDILSIGSRVKILR